MEIGKKIKQLRTAKGMTQETLAAELAVTPQAISKWECDITMPDIQLLPKLAILFGVTIDELFCLTDENELDRIQNMIWDERMLPQASETRRALFNGENQRGLSRRTLLLFAGAAAQPSGAAAPHSRRRPRKESPRTQPGGKGRAQRAL